jgi:hexosaminidase
VPGLQQWSGGTGRWSLGSKTRVVVDAAAPKALSATAKRLAVDLRDETGIRVPVVTGGQVGPSDIGLSLRPCSSAAASQIGAEGYTLAVGRGVMLRANPSSSAHPSSGLFYATRTLLQALALDGSAPHAHRTIAQGYAVDWPRYQQRTVMIDVARSFVDVPSLEAYMQFMGWYKLNTLHLHLSDDVRRFDTNTVLKAAFRLHSNRSAFANPPTSDDGLYYSKSDWTQLENGAAANGVTIVPEIDTPAHATAMVRALGGTGATLDVSDPAALTYAERVWSEFLPWFRSPVVHIGGDEAGNPTGTQAYLSALAKFLQQKSKTVEVWNDSATSPSTYDPSIIIMNWQNYAPLPWLSATSRWVNASSSFYVTPNIDQLALVKSLGNGMYEEAAGFAGDSFYADDSTLGIPHPSVNLYSAANPEVWDWFGNLDALGATKAQPLGGQIQLWQDLAAIYPFSFDGLATYLLDDALPAAGQIWWKGQEHDAAGNLVPYSVVRRSVATLQYGPGTEHLPTFAAHPLSATSPPSFAQRPTYTLTPAHQATTGTLHGTATKATCSSCGKGLVTGLSNTGTLTMQISAARAGTYLLPIQYVSGSAATLDGDITVNTTTQKLSFPLSSIDGQSVARIGTFVALRRGNNTIRFSSTDSAMPAIAGLEQPILQP